MQVMTVSAFLSFVNETFKAIWDSTGVAVEGEVSGFKISQGQWVNFDLKDETSTLSVFMVVRDLHVPVQDGMRVRLFGFPRVYPKYGKFSFNAEKVELVGEGTLRKALALLRQKLELEGLFDPSRKRALPKYPSRIALIASRESAAYGDFIRIVNERWRGLSVDLYHVIVQGDQAPGQIVKAIEAVQSQPYDAIVLTRGGGSFEELMAFNDERLVRAIHASRIPTLVGIGHERDITLAEEAADVRGSTPTDCARRLVPDRGEVLFGLAQSQKRMRDVLAQWLEDWSHSVEYAVEAVGRWLVMLQDRLAATDRLLRSLDPSGVLKRGYAMVLDEKGAVRTRAAGLIVNQPLLVRFQDGDVNTKVTSAPASPTLKPVQPTLFYAEKETGT